MSLRDNPDEILKKHWLKKGSVKVGNIIGSGGYGRVYAGWYNGLKVAIKDYGVIYDELSWDDKMDIMEEFSLMKDLNHTNTVRVYGFIMNRGCIALVMEYANGGEVFDYLVAHGRMKEREARTKFRQILSAVQYMHQKRIVHRDLKVTDRLSHSDFTVFLG